jgi:hypothetical protein
MRLSAHAGAAQALALALVLQHDALELHAAVRVLAALQDDEAGALEVVARSRR